MAMDREKEREMELESAMYTNCLLLGLDPDIIGVGPNDAIPWAGLFSHSNPKLGKQLLYFILSSLRGPIQSAKDFDNVWPILDSAQSRNFQKVVQGIISELESQGVLPRSDSGVSSVVICCGPRFVELLWQLSVHALREVHMRTFAADVALTPLPAPLTDVAFSLADTLLPVTKARIALERRRFLKNAETAVQRQALWSNLALEMTAEFRGLCAEEAYLQQELEKLHHLRNKVKLGGDLWDELVSSSSQNARTVQRATRLWDSLSSCKSQYDVLASGPIKDHIARREHRFQISGSSLLAAMDQSSLVPFTHSTPQNLDNEEIEGPQADVKKESKSMLDSSLTRGSEENNFQVDERNTRRQPTVDIAEVFRRWTHALRHVQNQSVQLAKANNGEGPDLLRSVHDGGTSNHAESLAETLAEHRQHLKNIQVLLNQLNDVAPTIQNSISELMDEVISLSSNLNLRSNLPIQAHVTGRAMGIGNDDNVEIKRPSSLQLEKVSARPSTLKLPPLYSSTPNSSGKGRNMQKRQTEAQVIPIETITEKKSLEQPPSTGHMNNQHDEDIYFLQNLKKSVRAAALSSQLCNLDSSQDSHSDDSSEHFFIRLSRTGFSHPGQDKKLDSLKSRQLFTSQKDSSLFQMHAKDFHLVSKYSVAADVSNDSNSLDEYDGVNDFLSAVGSNSPVSDAYGTFIDMDEAQDQVSSPPLLMDAAILEDSYEDLLAPFSDSEAAMLKH